MQKTVKCELTPATLIVKLKHPEAEPEKQTIQIPTKIDNSENNHLKKSIERQFAFDFKTETAKKTFDFLNPRFYGRLYA